MTIIEAREHPDFKKAYAKIKNYREGFVFRIDFTKIPKAKGNALKILLRDAVNDGYLESVSIEIGWDMETAAETYKRTIKK